MTFFVSLSSHCSHKSEEQGLLLAAVVFYRQIFWVILCCSRMGYKRQKKGRGRKSIFWGISAADPSFCCCCFPCAHVSRFFLHFLPPFYFFRYFTFHGKQSQELERQKKRIESGATANKSNAVKREAYSFGKVAPDRTFYNFTAPNPDMYTRDWRKNSIYLNYSVDPYFRDIIWEKVAITLNNIHIAPLSFEAISGWVRKTIFSTRRCSTKSTCDCALRWFLVYWKLFLFSLFFHCTVFKPRKRRMTFFPFSWNSQSVSLHSICSFPKASISLQVTAKSFGSLNK